MAAFLHKVVLRIIPVTNFAFISIAIIAGALSAGAAMAQSGPPIGSTVVFTDSFESGTGNWSEDSQNDWFSSTQRAVDGSRSAEVDGYASNAQLISPVIDLQGASTAYVGFSWLIERRVDSGEYLALDISTDGGNSWTERARLRGNVDSEDTWHHVELEIASAAVLSLRFRGKMSRSNEDANVDSVYIAIDGGAPQDIGPSVEITSPPDGATVGGDVLVTVVAEDDVGVDKVDFSIDGNFIISDQSAPYQIAWGTAGETDGDHTISVVATDTIGQTDSAAVTVTVENQASAPTITSTPNTSAVEGTAYSYAVTASDADANDTQVYSLTAAPPGMTIGSASGAVEWVPGSGQVGSHYVEVKVTDGAGLSDSQGFYVTVTEAPSNNVVFSDSFESGTGYWSEDSQNDWFSSTQRAADGSRSAEVDGYASDAQLISPDIDLNGRPDAAIDFSWLIESGVDSGEYVAFDVSLDGGSSWTEMARLRGNVDQENTWHSVHAQLNDIPALRLRFRGKMSRSSEDANVDNVVVTASGEPGSSGPPVDDIDPDVSITSPSSSGSYSTTSSSISVSGTASDNEAVSAVTWRLNGGSSSNASGLQDWSVQDIPLALGTNVVEVTASDAAGNTATAQIVITRDSSSSPPPVLHGIAVMGDSNSDEYQANDNRGGSYSSVTLNWVEQLAAHRELNFGSWGSRSSPRRDGYAYNWALSGATASSMISGGQHTGVAQQVAAGEVSLVAIYIGVNDFARDRYTEIYNGSVSGQALQDKIQGIIQNITTAVDTVQAAGPVNVVVTDIYDYSLPDPNLVSDYPDAAARQVVTDAIRSVNAGIASMAQQRGAAVVDLTQLSMEVFANVDANWMLNVGGELIDMLNPGNEPHHAQLNDSSKHPGTVINGIFYANKVFINTVNTAFGTSITPFTDNEILQTAGIAP
jgi:hypothetical protein